METSEHERHDRNKDPLTGAPGSHPASTGAGAITGGLVGAAAGSIIGGPVGAAIGIGVGAVAGGLGGKAMAETIDETEEEAYWHREHHVQPYGLDSDYEKYTEAYRVGYQGAQKYPQHSRYEDVEADLERDYGAHTAGLPWDKAQPAARAAWHRAKSKSTQSS